MFYGLSMYVLGATFKSRMLYLHMVVVSIVSLAVYFAANSEVISTLPQGLELSIIGPRKTVSDVCSVLIFLAVFSASRVVPWMLKPGMSGFFLARPLSRARFLTYTSGALALSYSLLIGAGGLIYATMYASLLAPHAFGDVALQVGLEVLIFLLYVPFIVFFSVSTRSGSLAFMGSFAVWLAAWLLASRSGLLTFLNDDLLWMIGDTLYYILPKSSEISELGWPEALAGGKSGVMALWSSTLTAAVVFVLSILRFRRMEF